MAGVQRRRRAAPHGHRPRRRRRPVARDRGARPLADVTGVRRLRRAAAVPACLPPGTAGRRPARVRHPRRHLLPSRRLARRRVPRRPRGLLLPASLRHHEPGPAVGRPRAGGRGDVLHRSATPKAKRNITGVLQHGESFDRDWNPGGLWRPVGIDITGPVRIDRCRVLCRDANDTRAHLRLHARLDSDAPRSARVTTWIDGAAVARQDQPLAARQQRGRVEPRHRQAAAVVAVVDGRAAADRGARRGGRRRQPQRRARGAHRPARGRAPGLGVLGQRRAAVRQGRQPGAHRARSLVGLARRSAARHRPGARGRARPRPRQGPHRPPRAVRRRRRARHAGVAGLPAARRLRPIGAPPGRRAGAGRCRRARPPPVDRGVVRPRHARGPASSASSCPRGTARSSTAG